MNGNKMILIAMHLVKEACKINFETGPSCNTCPLRAKCDVLFAGNNCIPFGFQIEEDYDEW